MPEKFLKHLEGQKGLYEIRVEHSSNILVRLNKYTMAKKASSITNFNEHLTGRYGARGSEKRTEFEIKAKAFLIGELIKEERKKELEERKQKELSKGKLAFTPNRKRNISKALKAYAMLVSSADKGAIRMI